MQISTTIKCHDGISTTTNDNGQTIQNDQNFLVNRLHLVKNFNNSSNSNSHDNNSSNGGHTDEFFIANTTLNSNNDSTQSTPQTPSIIGSTPLTLSSASSTSSINANTNSNSNLNSFSRSMPIQNTNSKHHNQHHNQLQYQHQHQHQQQLQSKYQQDVLLQWKDMPQYLQFNPYVLTGYRPLQTFKGCFFSLFYWHNETINILTHAIPIVYILAIVPGLMPWDKEYRFLSFCHVFGSVAPWCGSFIYHLFMNLERGENVYYRLLKLDMIGIWVSQSFGALPMLTATTYCFGTKLKWLIIIVYCMMALWGLYKAVTASSPWQRRLCFAMPFTMRSILIFLRTVGLVDGTRVALSHVYLQDGVSIFGGAIGAMRIPEKWFPGLVDFYLNSHNIMHVLVVVAVYSMHQATISDLEWMSKAQCNTYTTTNATIESTINGSIEL